MTDNKLSLNVSKTDFVIVGTQSKVIDFQVRGYFVYNGSKLKHPQSPICEIFRIFIDENLD